MKNLKQVELCNVKNGGVRAGILAALVPHIGCILFIVLTLFGISVGAVFIKQFLLMWWAFPALILFSFLLAGISSYFYLKRNCCANKTRYLSILFGSVIVINALLFFVIFPWTANLSGRAIGDVSELSEITLSVAIPCPGHASLIVDELKKIGVEEVTFNFPNIFVAKYNFSKVDKSQITNLNVFKTYKATVIK